MKYNNTSRYDELKALYSRTNKKEFLQGQFPYTFRGKDLFIPNRTEFTNTKVIAGPGSKTELRIADKLVRGYGGEKHDWTKKVGKIESDKYIFDLHWYELDNKQYQMKMKHRGDKK